MSIGIWKIFQFAIPHYTAKGGTVFESPLFTLADFQMVGGGYGILRGCVFATQWKSLHLPHPFFTFWQPHPNHLISRCFMYLNPGNNHCFRCKLLNRLSRKKTQNPLTTGYINIWKISWIIFAKTLTFIYVFGIILVWR